MPGLARSLNNLSVDLSDSGDHDGALAASREAVALRRTLAAANPARFAADLANSLNTLAEAIPLIEPFAATWPESRFGRWLAIMRHNRAR